MGRPSRKRRREAERATSVRKQPLPLDRNPSYPFGERSNSGLQSLVISYAEIDSTEATDGAGAGEKTATTSAVVQGVWGGVAEADIAAAASTLTLGVDAHIDGAGVAWLVNTSIHEHLAEFEKTKTPPLSERQGCFQRASHHTRTVLEGDTVASAACRESPLTAGRPGCGDKQRNTHEAAPPSGTRFDACEPSLREQLSRVKEEFDDIPPVVFKRARSACNPAEAIGSGSFLNRSAMKLANIDAVLGGKLSLPSRLSVKEASATEKTLPVKEGQVREPLRDERSPPTLLFADLCGGPGGFSEYLLRRRRQLGLPARGWGISLREGLASGGVRGGDRDVVEDAAVGDPTSDKNRAVGTVGNGRVGDSGDHLRISGVLDGGDGGAAVTDEIFAPRTGSVAREGAPGRGIEVREEMSRDGHCSSKKDEDNPCAWRLDHLRPWCDVSVVVSRKATATPNGMIVDSREGEGHGNATVTNDISTAASTSAANSSSTAAAGDAVTAPPLEMRIDYGPKGTGDVTDEGNMQGFVESILESTGGRRLGLVVADGGFGAARDDPNQERLLSTLLHAEVCYVVRAPCVVFPFRARTKIRAFAVGLLRLCALAVTTVCSSTLKVPSTVTLWLTLGFSRLNIGPFLTVVGRYETCRIVSVAVLHILAAACSYCQSISTVGGSITLARVLYSHTFKVAQAVFSSERRSQPQQTSWSGCDTFTRSFLVVGTFPTGFDRAVAA